MQHRAVKYSIIVPVKNALKYLPECINSVIRQDYSDYELIISDDHSVDGTKEYLNTISHPNIKILHYEDESFTATENFNFSIQFATGEWIMYLGADDGLQPYFFYLSDQLIEIAEKRNIRAIGSKRAYFFWDGCQTVYSDVAVIYSADFKNKYSIRRSSIEIIKTLLGFRDSNYYSLPQMYATSLFHFSLIEDAKKVKGGRFLTFSFPDADLAAISTSIEKKFIESNIPLGWVGTSPKTIFRDENLIENMASRMPLRCGDFHLRSQSIWFWGALLDIPEIQKNKLIVKLISSKLFMSMMFSQELCSIMTMEKKEQISKKKMLNDLLKINNCSNNFVSFLYRFSQMRLSRKLFSIIFSRLPHIISSMFVKTNILSKNISHTDYPGITLSQASNIVMQLTNGYKKVN